MKAIFVLFDTLNRRFLPPYGSQWVHAPNFERLAQRAVTFDNCYIGSMPCIPARRELHTGRYNFLHRSWGPLEPFDDSMPLLLKQTGVYTHLVSDHLHYWEDGGATYHTRYNSWEIVRGQSGDPWKGQVNDPPMPDDVLGVQSAQSRQDWVNRQHITTSAQHPMTRTFDLGIEFLHTNHATDNWFLQIETFSPHEPFFALPEYRDLYSYDYDGPHFDWPKGCRVSESAEQIEHVRHLAAAVTSHCDEQLGRVMDIMDELELWDDTLLIVGTDHGFLLGEHGWWGKIVQPFYNEIAHTPLFIWDPRAKCQGERRRTLVQMIDLAPTLLEYFQIPAPHDMQGMALSDTIATDTPVREAALFGIHGAHVCVTDGRIVYMRAPATANNQPLYNYTLMPSHMCNPFSLTELQAAETVGPFSFSKGVPLLRTPAKVWGNTAPMETLLFDLENDPGQQIPLSNADIEQMMIAHLTRLMVATDAPPEQFKRLGLPTA